MKKRFLFWGTAVAVLASLAFIGCKKKCDDIPDVKPPIESQYSFEYRGAVYQGFITGTIKSDSTLQLNSSSVNQVFKLWFKLKRAKPDTGTYKGDMIFSTPVGSAVGKMTVVISQATDSTAIGTFSGIAHNPTDRDSVVEKGNFSVRIK